MKDSNTVILTALSSLTAGGVLLYPTDTIWGLGCDAANVAAVERLYALKRRDPSKSMLVLCADVEMVEAFVGTVSPQVRALLTQSERPTTVIMPLLRHRLAENLVAADGTIGVRIPRMELCRHLAQALCRPLVSTSANLSGHPSPASFADIDPLLLQSVDYTVPPEFEVPTDGVASRIVKLQPDGSLTVIRQ